MIVPGRPTCCALWNFCLSSAAKVSILGVTFQHVFVTQLPDTPWHLHCFCKRKQLVYLFVCLLVYLNARGQHASSHAVVVQVHEGSLKVILRVTVR